MGNPFESNEDSNSLCDSIQKLTSLEFLVLVPYCGEEINSFNMLCSACQIHIKRIFGGHHLLDDNGATQLEQSSEAQYKHAMSYFEGNRNITDWIQKLVPTVCTWLIVTSYSYVSNNGKHLNDCLTPDTCLTPLIESSSGVWCHIVYSKKWAL